MAKFAPWGDLFKFSTEVLDEDYIHDKNFQIKAKTKTGDDESSFKIEQSRPDAGESTNSFEFKHKYVDQAYTSDNKIASGGKVVSANEVHLSQFHENLKGFSYTLTFNLVSGKAYDTSSLSSALKLKQSGLEGKVTFDHGKKGDFDVEGTVKLLEDKDYYLGGSGSFKVKEARLGKFAFGFANKCSDSLSTGWQLACGEKDKYGTFKLYTLRQASDHLKFAANLEYVYFI